MEISDLAVPSVYLLISFLAYSSQWLFLYLEPGPISRNQLIKFNVLLICLFISYTQSCFVDPGTIPKRKEYEEKEIVHEKDTGGVNPRKWCRKCNAAKPPRAHHCKQCKRCIPKMDHHCPWTSNCVSHTTFPHFVRFLFYAVTSLVYLLRLLYPRLAYLWANRDMPSYLGPSILQLAHLFLLTPTSMFLTFALGILLVRNLWCLAVNTTTIEGWEIERHRTLLRRARHFGGVLEGPDGTQVPIRKQEFPYDIGIWANIVQGMGSANPINWFNPLSFTPPIVTGLTFETNGFEDPGTTWPPPDPDRMQRSAYVGKKGEGMGKTEEGFTFKDAELSNEDQLRAFRERQTEDLVRRRKPFVQRLEEMKAMQQQQGVPEYGDREGFGSEEELSDNENARRDTKDKIDSESGEEAWRNSEGERLRDFGVDEDVEFYDEDEDVPLSELLAKRRAAGLVSTAATP